MDTRERLSRALCKFHGVNPDQVTQGVKGSHIGASNRAVVWKYFAEYCTDPILKDLREGDLER